jgi:hypothetical protein
MKEWRNASDKEIEDMTRDEAIEIIQKHIDAGVFAIKHPDQAAWCPRKHMTRALQILLEENMGLRNFLFKAILEMRSEHYGDASLAYSMICDILNEADKYMREAHKE